jgi:hypothetical protein
MKAKVKKLVSKIEAVGLKVKYDDSDEKNPHIEIYRKKKMKKSIMEIVFDKYGNMAHVVVGKDETHACWIDVPKTRKK